eukprot:COSAG01_NODE_636_length_14635_cov_18.612617_3_plen_292_part_00
MFSAEQDILLILGPTASGKSELAIQIAKQYKACIISADAYQVYKGMDIGTAKVSWQQRELVAHHLIDIKTPDEGYSAAEFAKRCKTIIQACRQKQQAVIVCGGTALYLHAFLYDYDFPVYKHNHKMATALLKQYPEKQDLWAYLKQVDPEAAEHIHANNQVRVLRALQVTLTSGKPFSQQKQKSQLRSDVKLLGIDVPRAQLYRRINSRVDHMIKQGLVEEVYALQKSGYNQRHQALQAIGYKEVLSYIAGDFDKETMINKIKQNTRHFAKRQLTWFRKFEQVTWQASTLD